MSRRVLGLSCSGHGASLCLVEDGRLVRAVNLERLTRVKHSLVSLPSAREAVARLLSPFWPGETLPLLDAREAFFRMLEDVTGETDLVRAGIDLLVRGHDVLDAARGRPDHDAFVRELVRVPVHDALEHHVGHAHQAFLCSPFDDAAILTVDGSGERLDRLGGRTLCATLGVGEGARVTILAELDAAHSVGALYNRVTAHLGFRGDQEGVTMALAAFGSDRFHRTIAPTFRPAADGTYTLDWDAAHGEPVWSRAMRAFCPRRDPGAPITDAHRDLAAGCQALTETALVHLARGLHARTGKRRLVLAGGVALNCVANARLLRDTPFEEIYVMPNAGDRGLAAGAALFGHHALLGGVERRPPADDYLGRPLGDAEIEADLRAASGIAHRRCEDAAEAAAALLAGGAIVGWVQGGAEFGPRALGHRSLLADPRTIASKERLDRDVKRREPFRPYAPSVLAERADELFAMHGPSPHMLQAVPARPAARERVPAVVHADGTARVQTVGAGQEPRYHRLLQAFARRTGVPLVLNTSLNGYGEPMAETAADAVRCLQAMGFDALVVGDHLVWRAGGPDPGVSQARDLPAGLERP